ncbi:hypothetical protein SAMN02745244_01903 [Tessaracoccus bendigoensis DSM 12906]|uniref:Uncharacterized protein n=1 Tax=Tessaracoccus bendigoensis DSM 12906 TaxID=1123357 RepID=A0A1M6H8B7_9ACTN|nr:hypothetical protein [Tessaracoccus bendigoensis]SHJ18426.1 hypothetical protein SAMN02745244_01903 [Tessaracoccus bendigoensis DSM 12906]
MFAGITLVIIVLIAVGVGFVVAVSSGQFRVKDQRVERIVSETNQRLNGNGQVPQFLRKLDERAESHSR